MSMERPKKSATSKREEPEREPAPYTPSSETEDRLDVLLLQIKTKPHWTVKSLVARGATQDDINELRRRKYVRVWYGDSDLDPWATPSVYSASSTITARVHAKLKYPGAPVFVQAVKFDDASEHPPTTEDSNTAGQHPPTMRENCDALADLLDDVVIGKAPGARAACELLRDSVLTHKDEYKAGEPIGAFQQAAGRAIDGVHLLDSLDRRIGGVPPREWQDILTTALRRLGGLHTRHQCILFSGADVAMLTREFGPVEITAHNAQHKPLMVVDTCCSQLCALHMPRAADAESEDGASEGVKTGVDAVVGVKDDDAERRYNMTDLRKKTGLSNKTIGCYAKKAKVVTPGRGKRNHSWGYADVCLILESIIAGTSETGARNKCQTSLDDLRETEKK